MKYILISMIFDGNFSKMIKFIWIVKFIICVFFVVDGGASCILFCLYLCLKIFNYIFERYESRIKFFWPNVKWF